MQCAEDHATTAAYDVRASAVHGNGVFAAAPLRAGQLIGRFEGEATTQDGTYVLWIIDDDEQEIGIEGRNGLRFLNHSGKPNAEFVGQDLYALCDLPSEAELMIDYGEGWAEG